MAKLAPINYRNKKYPNGITPRIKEIPAHFDSKETIPMMDYSLHTEYAYLRREFTLPTCRGLPGIKVTDSKGIPTLWFDSNWVKDFGQFILRFTENSERKPKIIEIHPPFKDYCSSVSQFVGLYKEFEEGILQHFETEIVVENRNGSPHRDPFTIREVGDLEELAELIEKNNLKLRIALDMPQLFSAHHFESGEISKKELDEIFNRLHPIRKYIKSIHLWGRCVGRDNKVHAHMGTLDSYFERLHCDEISYTNETLNLHDNLDNPAGVYDTKGYFLNKLYNLLDDGITRYIVPEVNSRPQHLQSIIRDLIDTGFEFVV